MDVFKVKLSEEEKLQAQLDGDVTVVNNYNEMTHKPSIEGVTLQGDVTLAQLGLQHVYYGTKEFWDSQPTLVSEEGAIYIYSDYTTTTDEQGNVMDIPAFKVGDGSSYLIDMPTSGGDAADYIIDHINNTIIHITSDDRTFWDNKTSAYLQPGVDETLVLSNDSFMLGGVIYNHG